MSTNPEQLRALARPFASRDPKTAAMLVSAADEIERLHAELAKARGLAADMAKALEDLLPYAIPTIGPPRPLWQTDSVILKAEALIALNKGAP